MTPATIATDDTSSNIAHTRLFVAASPTLPVLQSPRRTSWTRPPFAAGRCSCRAAAAAAGTLDVAAATGRCCAAADGGVTTAGHLLELGRLSPAHCPRRRRLSADDVGELNGGVLVETATLGGADDGVARRDPAVYLPLGRVPPLSVDHYLRSCNSITGHDHALIADARLHDNPDLLFAS